uniref:NADH dehydrogenase subunit 6 n=1 Tax=Pheidole tristis TaxID=615606 RepID=A0A343YVQ1_9HYME|nr:NADH dehydrogenase subunit 6 [Pheidole tristis]
MFMLMFILFMLLINHIHPIFTLILILIYSSIICLLMSSWSHNYMYSIMLFLILVSGMLIMFLYFSSLISNEQTKIYINFPLTISLIINMTIIYKFMKYFNYPLYNFNEKFTLFNLNYNLFNNILHMYSYPYTNITLICILYLLITLLTMY